MKQTTSLLFFLLVIGACSANLQQDLQDILNVIPLIKISEISEKHSKDDPQFQQVEAYIKGKKFQALIAEVEGQDAFQQFKTYLFEVGLDVQKIFDFIKRLLDDLNKKTLNNTTRVDESGESLRSFLDEVEAVVPWQKVQAVTIGKLMTSEDFKEFYNTLCEDKTYQLAEKTRNLPDVQELINILEGMQAKVKDTLAAIYAILGWPLPNED